MTMSHHHRNQHHCHRKNSELSFPSLSSSTPTPKPAPAPAPALAPAPAPASAPTSPTITKPCEPQHEYQQQKPHHHERLIHLNVGGLHFTTTHETLTAFEHESFLSNLSEKNTTTSLNTTIDENGRLFIDRDGERFRIILNYLRSGHIEIIENNCVFPGHGYYGDIDALTCGGVSLRDLREDADFYGLEGLCQIIDEELTRIELEQDMDYRQQALVVNSVNSEDSCSSKSVMSLVNGSRDNSVDSGRTMSRDYGSRCDEKDGKKVSEKDEMCAGNEKPGKVDAKYEFRLDVDF